MDRVPEHVAIIMDGNGRWAESRRHRRTAGHIRGARRAKEIVEAAENLGIRHLTLFGFSSENWSRPKSEVSLLMSLLHKYLASQASALIRRNARVRVFGDWAAFPPDIVARLKHLIEATRQNTGINVNFAFNYGARQEILQACRRVTEKVLRGDLSEKDVTETCFAENLDTAGVPDPDLIIRTSGEQRLSNFLLWQSAYSEFYFTPVLWPDFDAAELARAVDAYQKRGRRFGGLGEAHG